MAYLYCIIESDSPEGPCKVGIATNLSKRLSSLQGGNWRPLEIAWYQEIERSMAYQIEQRLLMWCRPNPYDSESKEQLSSEWLSMAPGDLLVRANDILATRMPEAA